MTQILPKKKKLYMISIKNLWKKQKKLTWVN